MSTTIGDKENVTPTVGQLQEADVVVVVGGREFHESSHFLRSISNYFEAAFRSGMKESRTMRFEFPDKAPREWELIMSLARPFPNKQIKEATFKTALSWFDELDMPYGREACGKFVLEQLKKKEFKAILSEDTPDPVRTTLIALFRYFQASYQFNLNECKGRCVELVKKLLESSPCTLHRNDWVIICSVLAEHKDCGDELFQSFTESLPPGLMLKHDPVELCSNVLLPDLICAEVQRREKEVGVKAIIRVTKSYYRGSIGVQVDEILKHDSTCAKVMERPIYSIGSISEAKRTSWYTLWT